MKRLGRLDSVSVGGMAVFGALAVLLTTLSQALGLNFPLVPYLQFDFGEVAILLAFFVFGPVPALVSSFIEFLTLMAIGQNVASFGPEFKLVAMVSSVAGIWLGTVLVSKMRNPSLGRAVGFGTTLGIALRASVMTLPNYYLIAFIYTVPAMVGFLGASFGLVGIKLNDGNAIALILGTTAVFNGLQLLLVSLVSYFLVRLPQVRNTRPAGRMPWILSCVQRTA